MSFAQDNRISIVKPTVLDLMVFSEYLIMFGLALGTVLNNLSAVKTSMLLRSYDVSAFSDYHWNLYVKSVKHTIRKGENQRPGFTSTDISHLIMYCLGKEELLVLAVALSFGYFGFLRGSNLAPPTKGGFDPTRHTTVGDVVPQESGLHVKIKWAKNMQVAVNSTFVPLPDLSGSVLNPTAIWVKYVNHLNLQPTDRSAPLLQYVDSGGKLSLVTLPRLRAMLNTALLACGLKSRGYSLHSLRRGGATLVHEFGMSLEAIKLHGLWRSDVVLQYIASRSSGSSLVVAKFMHHFAKAR